MFPKTIALAVLSLSGVSLTTACSALGGGANLTSTPSPAASCAGAPTLTSKTPTVAVLTETGLTPYSADLSRVVQGATALKARVIVNGVGSSMTAPNLQANDLLVAQGPNDLERQTDLACKQAAVTSAVTALSTRAKPSQLDVVGGLDTLQQDLVGAPPSAEVDVVLFGSMLNTAPPLTLDDSTVLDNPVAAINALAAQGLLPRCSGWRVYAISEGAGPQLSDVQSSQLESFWRQFFSRCGGALVDWDSSLTTFPVSSGQLAAADRAQIPVPVQHRPGVIVATLAGDVTFETGSAILTPQAQLELPQVLALVPPGNGKIVVTGYTDNTGTDAVNGPLSQARAQAVVTWLIDHGVAPSRLTFEGDGSADPIATNQTAAGRSMNRRTTVEIFTSKD